MFPLSQLFSLKSTVVIVANPTKRINVLFSLSCTILLFFLCWGFLVFIIIKLYKKSLGILRIFQHSILRQSIAHPLCHTPRILFWHPLGLIVPFAFYSSFDTLWHFLCCSVYSPQMKAAISARSRDRKRNNFLLVSTVCKAIVLSQAGDLCEMLERNKQAGSSHCSKYLGITLLSAASVWRLYCSTERASKCSLISFSQFQAA